MLDQRQILGAQRAIVDFAGQLWNLSKQAGRASLGLLRLGPERDQMLDPAHDPGPVGAVGVRIQA